METTNTVKPLYRGTQIVWYIFYFIETVLAFRFLLKLLGANTGAGFTKLIYGISYPFAEPFRYVVGSPRVGGSTLEWGTLLAMLVYWIVAWGIVRLIVMGKPVSQVEAHVKLNEQDVTN
ncbi:MAG TPA: YggT family protein [Candidatus Paceibacterota bacterium]